ncbi:transporter substrate-binding domain-containing protein [Rothia mucilaginosa]|uniref:transporter substrate-binding domain-containing protein n=1 Tax=Rothia mucilaginosa TaxID=43675 RepID=UPI000A6EE86E|nr:transporter substrate-binding domain-containing protein [Rothia mucilaginosa]
MTVLKTSAVLNRRSLLLGAALAGTTGLLAACSGGNGSSAGSAQSSSNLLESIKSAGKIRIGVEGTYRPYTYHDASGKLAGFEYDIAETLAKDLGVTAEYIETPWDSLIAEKYDFSVPYAHSRARVGVKKDSSLKNASEISGHTAAQSATSNYRKLVEERGATIIEVTGFDEAIEQVLTGRAELTANDSVSFAEYFKEHPDANLRLLEGEVGPGTNVAVLLPKNQAALKDAIDASIKKHLGNGDFKAIFEKHVGEDLSPAS